MLKTLRWTWPVILLAVMFLLPWGCYLARPTTEMKVVVLDKTVPFRTWVEHQSLFWLMNHLKVRNPAGEPYNSRKDYLGAFPGPEPGNRPATTRDLALSDAMGADLVYIADTYGVYEDDLKSGSRMKAALERSRKIYGGLESSEADAAVAALQSGKRLIVEFNTLASPTGAAARETMEQALGVRWTRWVGRYFPRLEDEKEVPRWLVENYQREWDLPWEFQGAGYVLLRDDAHVEVLRVGKESKRDGLVLMREQPVDPVLIGARDGVSYAFWFSIVEPSEESQVLASFSWNLTQEGQNRLLARGLPMTFPAVVRNMAPGGGVAYYFAGDFADNPMPQIQVPLAGYTGFKRSFEKVRLYPSEAAFYWRFYVPMMSRILLD
jgi:hypothetical protein